MNIIFTCSFIVTTVVVLNTAVVAIPFFASIIGITLSLLRSLSWEATFTDKKKEELNKMFGYFLEPRLIEKLLKNPELIHTSGKRKLVTVLFGDLRGFTKFCEKSSPETVVSVLRVFYNRILPLAQKNNGVIDKIIGDAVMILFNEPIEHREHARNAVRTAIEMQEAMDKAQKEMSELTKTPLKLGIGINSEEVVVGTIGTKDFCDYTALGSGVNLAARIESSCPGGRIYISENTFNLVQGKFDMTVAGEFSFKNISCKEKVWQVNK